MRIIQLQDEMLRGVVGGISRVGGGGGGHGGGGGGGSDPYETVVVDNGHIYVALDKTPANIALDLTGADILVANDRVLVIKP